MDQDKDKSWYDRLQRAKWRGFGFSTDSHDSSHGQRLVVTELPGADEPVLEDLGAKASTYKLTAYFIGSQYDRERNKFLQLLGQSGADWLTHPWLGLVWARAHTWSVHESTDKGGYCCVTVDFVPGGQAPSVPYVDAVDTAFGLIREMVVAAEVEPKTMSPNALASFIARVQGALGVVRNMLAMARLPLTWAQQVIGLIDSMKATVAEVLALPGEYAAMMHSLASALGLAPDDFPDSDRVRIVAMLARNAVTTANEPLVGLTVGVGSPAGVDAQVTRVNAQADSVMRATLMVSAAMSVALADYGSAQARDTAQVAVLSALDVLMSKMSDALFMATANARAAFMTALQAQALDVQMVHDVVHATPSVVLAYELGLTEAELLGRNAVRHPLFMQGRVYV